MTLELRDITFAYGKTRVLKGISLGDLRPGSLTALIGPNAAGKSTLLKCMVGLLKASGEIRLNDRTVTEMSRRDRVRSFGYLPQVHHGAAVLTAFEAVLLAVKQGESWRVTHDDQSVVSETLALVGIQHLALRYLDELSGGQRQLVSLAQALVRRPRVLLLDEPTSALDLRNQLEVFALLRTMARLRHLIIVMAVHDLNMAARFADRVVLLRDGAVATDGPPEGVLRPDRLRDVYGIEAHVAIGGDGVPVVQPLKSLREPVAAAAA